MARLSRKTRQKALMEEVLSSSTSFFSAEEFFKKAQKEDFSLGIATVYRFLKETLKQGALHAYTCGRSLIYSREKNAHCHFICEKCGRTMHFPVETLDFLKKNVPGAICHFQLDVYGICKSCA